jgi:hypothetical protein
MKGLCEPVVLTHSGTCVCNHFLFFRYFPHESLVRDTTLVSRRNSVPQFRDSNTEFVFGTATFQGFEVEGGSPGGVAKLTPD